MVFGCDVWVYVWRGVWRCEWEPGYHLCMTDRRPGPPLFELLGQDQPDPDHGDGSGRKQDSSGVQKSAQADNQSGQSSSGQSTGTRSSQSSSSNEDGTSPRPVISAGVSRAERSAATMPEEPVAVEGGVHLSMSRVYMSIALIALALVLVWAMAYKSGVEYGKRDMESLLPNKSMVLPPNEFQSGTNPENQLSTEGAVDNSVTEPPRVPAKPAQAVMTAQGYQDADPRVPGSNYLQLATLSTEQAASAVIFMNENGIAIIGVPVVDSQVRAGNNPSRYTLYSLGLEVPGGAEFRAMETQRNEHRREIARLGEQWQRERRGGSDFAESKTQWVKYN